MTRGLSGLMTALAYEGFFRRASLLGAWMAEGGFWLVARPLQSPSKVEALFVPVSAGDGVREVARSLVAGWDDRVPRPLPRVRPWTNVPIDEPVRWGFDATAATLPVREFNVSRYDAYEAQAWRELALVQGVSWAEATLPRAAMQTGSPTCGIWIVGPDKFFVLLVRDARYTDEPCTPEGLWGSETGPRWMAIVHPVFALGNWRNPWDFAYFWQYTMLFCEIIPGVVVQDVKVYPDKFPRKDIYTLEPDARVAQLASSILARFPA